MRIVFGLRSMAVAALVAVFSWNLARRRQGRPLAPHRGSLPDGYERHGAAARPLAIDIAGAAADTARTTFRASRLATGRARALMALGLRVVRRQPARPAAGPHVAAVHEDGAPLQFEWMVRTSDPRAIRDALAGAGVRAEALPPPASDEPDHVLIDRLRQTGIPLDQEPGSGFVLEPAARYVGTASASRLVEAIARGLRVARTGLIVDTTEPAIAIDEHQDVGKGVIALVSAKDSRLVRADLERTLQQAFALAPARAG